MSEHILKQFDTDLESIRNRVMQMGGLVEQQIVKAMEGLVDGDLLLIEQTINNDDRVNRFEVELDEACTNIIARRQPALFLGGAFMLGLLVGRFVRSSSQNAGYQDGGFRGYQDYPGGGYQGSGYSGGSSYRGSGYEYNQGTGSGSGRPSSSGRPSVEMGAETGANESRYRQGPSVYNTSNQDEFGDNPTAYPTGLAEE